MTPRDKCWDEKYRYTNRFASAVFHQFTYNCSQGECLQPVHRAHFYNSFYTIHTDTCFLFSFFSFTICTRAAGSPLLLSYNSCSFSFCYFGNVCQQHGLPLLFAAMAVNAVPSFIFGGKRSVTGGCLYLGSLNRGLQGLGG